MLAGTHLQLKAERPYRLSSSFLRAASLDAATSSAHLYVFLLFYTVNHAALFYCDACRNKQPVCRSRRFQCMLRKAEKRWQPYGSRCQHITTGVRTVAFTFPSRLHSRCCCAACYRPLCSTSRAVQRLLAYWSMKYTDEAIYCTHPLYGSGERNGETFWTALTAFITLTDLSKSPVLLSLYF